MNRAPAPRKKRGRPSRPPRCVITIRQRGAGVVVHVASWTVDCEPNEAMRRIQQAFADEMSEFCRHTDDPRWYEE